MKSVFGILLIMTLALGTSASLAQNPEIDAEVVELATSGVASNDEWEPYIQEFDGVEMVLVPAGCFMMGSEDGAEDERPVHEQCFDEPFWIDRYEVTNDQFGSLPTSDICLERSSEPDQPRNCVDWFEARDHCEARGARLPTEREWEYAARGPDNLVYPWGNDYDTSLVIGVDDPTYGLRETAPVGSRPEGASWVGALDMSGNAWEWTKSLYADYPYDADDGREGDQGDSTDVLYVLRGGSFYFTAYSLRAACRYGCFPGFVFNLDGFRCVRSSG